MFTVFLMLICSSVSLPEGSMSVRFIIFKLVTTTVSECQMVF